MFWKVDDAKQSTEDLDNEETDGKTRRRFLLRYYRVFNLEQCELPQAVLDKLPKIETHEHDPIEAAERIIAGMPNPPEIQHAGSKAFYSPITDRITLPPRELFASAEEYYATALHETVHYADFRIMPRFSRGAAVAHGARARDVGIIRALPGRRATHRLGDSDRVRAPRAASSPSLFP